MKPVAKKYWAGFLILAALGAMIIYYAGDSKASVPQGGNMAVPVTVQTMQTEKVRTWTEFSGRLTAVDSAEICPEVNGRITEVRFEDGGYVKTGDVLFVIDPRPYAAAVAKSEADLATANTNAEFAQVEKQRAEELIKTQAIAQRLYDERTNADRVAAAAVKAAEAELKRAKLDLEHAYVRAPISGRASRAELTVGNLVQTSPNAPLLTTIVSGEEIYADFDVDEQTYIQNVRNVANNRIEERLIPVELTLRGDKQNRFQGTIYSFDNRIDVASGTIRARAKFANPGGVLIPGMFVSVNLASGAEEVAIMVPTKAIGFDQDKKFVFVVGDNNKVVYKEVDLGAELNGKRIVKSGLNPGDRVIIDGIQHVRPDVVVEPKEAAATAANAAPLQNEVNLLAKQ